MSFPRLFLYSLLVVCFANFGFGGAALLPPEEAKTLGKTNFSGDAWNNKKPWTNINTVAKSVAYIVTCNCSFVSSTVCHITSILAAFHGRRRSITRTAKLNFRTRNDEEEDEGDDEEDGGDDEDEGDDEEDAEPGSGISVGAVVGIVAGGVFVILLIFVILWRRGLLGQQNTLEDDLNGVELQTGKFTFRQLKDATNNFDQANKIGEGGFGPVYKGLLSDGTVIAVKQLSSKSKQGNHEFVNEIGMISALQHPNLVQLHGCCIEGNQLLLVYEYMENNSLARALFGPQESQLKLDWSTRHKICVGIARGLAYLHEESRLKVVHRDIKATNVLLDKNLIPKISDFGLAKLDEEDNTHISTRIAGTYGYMAPEYALQGYLTDKADVYSYGILVLEIASGRNNTTCLKSKEERFNLLDWAQLLKGQGNLMDLVDPRLGSDFNKEEMMLTINVALLCCNVTSTLRPTMSSVVNMLEGRAAVRELVSDPNASSNEIEAMRKHFQSSFGRNTGESQAQTASTEGPWTGSSSSAHDLYPVKPDSTYWDNRKYRN